MLFLWSFPHGVVLVFIVDETTIAQAHLGFLNPCSWSSLYIHSADEGQPACTPLAYEACSDPSGMYYMYMIVSSTTQDGFSPLYIASRWGRTEIVDILLRSGADPNLPCMVWKLRLTYSWLQAADTLVSLQLLSGGPTSDRAASSAWLYNMIYHYEWCVNYLLV